MSVVVSTAPTTTAPAIEEPARAAWGRRVGAAAGYVAGVGILGQTTLFLLDATDALAESPSSWRPTRVGCRTSRRTTPRTSTARTSVWSIIARDALGPVAFLALMVAGLAALNLLATRRPERQLLLLFFVVGCTLAAVSDLVYLTQTLYWQNDNWSADRASNMVAVGRSVEVIANLVRNMQYAGFLVLALGLVCLGRLTRLEPGWSRLLGTLAYVEAVGLLGAFAASVRHNETAYNVVALVIRVLLGPLGGGASRPTAGQGRARPPLSEAAAAQNPPVRTAAAAGAGPGTPSRGRRRGCRPRRGSTGAGRRGRGGPRAGCRRRRTPSGAATCRACRGP